MTDDDAVWESFHQQEELTTRLRNVLREYPQGVGPFKEFLQNADDAKAETFSLMLDESDRRDEANGGVGLLTKEMEEWQGPALLVYNSGVFTDEDFRNIRQVGNSEKLQDVNRIGKYGLGFNCAYHFTDLVSFVSRDKLVCFDPHGQYLPKGTLGARVNTTDPVSLATIRNQLISMHDLFGFHVGKEFNGTLFRLPFRTAERAEASLISSTHLDCPSVLSLLEEFASIADEMLLFLSYVKNVDILHRDETGNVRQIASVRVEGCDSTSRSRVRQQLSEFVKRSRKESEVENQDDDHTADENAPNFRYNRSYEITLKKSLEQETSSTCWLVNAASGSSDPSLDCSEDKDMSHFVVGIATPIVNNDDAINVEGRVYCHLPLPIETGLPVHINGSFALSSNRRELWFGKDMKGVGRSRAVYNDWILGNPLAETYLEVMESEAKRLQSFVRDAETTESEDALESVEAAFYRHWPDMEKTSEQYSGMVIRVATKISNSSMKLFWDPVMNGVHKYSRVHFEDANFSKHCHSSTLRHALRKAGLIIVRVPEHVRKMFEKAEVPVNYTTPSRVLHVMKGSQKPQLSYPDAESLLMYTLESSNKSVDLASVLNGTKLVPLINGQLGTFAQRHRHQAPGQGNSSSITEYVYAKPEELETLPSMPEFLNPKSSCFPKLSSPKMFETLNICPLGPSILAQRMEMFVPRAWMGCQVVVPQKEYTKGPAVAAADSDLSRKQQREMKKQGKLRAKEISKIGVLFVEQDVFVEALNKLESFWKFLQNYHTWKNDYSSIFQQWPLVPVLCGYGQALMTISQARHRNVFQMKAFNSSLDASSSKKEEKHNIGLVEAVLMSFGCSFLHPSLKASRHISQILQLKMATLEDAISRGFWRHPVPDLNLLCVDTEEFLSKSPVAGFKDIPAATQAKEGLSRALRTILIENNKRSSSADYLLELPVFETLSGKFGPGARSHRTPGGYLSPSERWDELLSDVMGDTLLSQRSTEAATMLHMVDMKRVKTAEFLELVLASEMDVMPKEVCLEFLKSVSGQYKGQTLPRRIEEAIETSRLIFIDADSDRRRISEVVDPADKLFSQVLRASDAGANYDFAALPHDYLAPAILKLLRKVGMMTLRNFPAFERAATWASENRGWGMCRELLQFLITHQSDLKWREPQWRRLGEIEFVPAIRYDRNTTLFPAPRTDFATLGDGSALGGVEVALKCPNSAALSSDSRQAWTQLWLLDPVIERLSHTHKQGLGIMHPVPLDIVVNHTKAVVSAYQEEFVSKKRRRTEVDGEELVRRMQYNMEDIYSFFDKVARSKKSRDVNFCSSELSSIRMFIADDGKPCLGSFFNFELEEDASETLRAIPSFLVKYSKLLKMLGTRDNFAQDQPIVHVRTEVPGGDAILEFLLQSFDDEQLCDVVFEVEGTEIWCHRVVLIHGSVHFRAMFTTGMKESSHGCLLVPSDGLERRGVPTLQMPEWVEASTLRTLLWYLYVGELIDFDTNKPLELSMEQKTIDTFVGLLRLSDMLLLDHLKEVCEKFLSKPEVLTSTNVCFLLTHAFACNAGQLEEMCIFSLRVYWQLIQKSDAWASLPPDIQSKCKMAVDGYSVGAML